MKISQVVLPVAGWGTRSLPASKNIPKEMLPIVDLPAVYYLVEEAVKSGITDILIITGRDKECMEEFFDYSELTDMDKKLLETIKEQYTKVTNNTLESCEEQNKITLKKCKRWII